MSEENDMKMLEARLAAVEAKMGQTELNTEGLISWPMFDVGMPPIVPIGGGGKGMFEWDADKRQIGPGSVMVGREIIGVQGSSEGLGDYTWKLKVTLTAQGAGVMFEQGGQNDQNTDTVTYLPLYTIEDGKMVKDMRGFFHVQCWE